MTKENIADGIHALLPRDQMCMGARKYRDFYDMVPGAGFYQKEFGFYSLEEWGIGTGIDSNPELDALFGYDPEGRVDLEGLGWCEAGFCPLFEEKVLEDLGDYELVQDFAGRSVLYFKGRRNGFMPQYKEHPVKDFRSWEEICLPRLDPSSPERLEKIRNYMPEIVEKAKQGLFIGQKIVGGYMYLRSLIGPENLLYMFYDDPELIHACMQQWLVLADAVTAEHQKYVSFDEVFIGEDICYNHGPLISPDMMREFLFPYYQQLITNIRSRQIDKERLLGFQVDTDGYSIPVIELYRSLGMTHMSPFEVASGCDVLSVAEKYPDLRISGGVDKRVLAQGKEAIDEMVDRIFPVMKARGGYLPTCDHGVPPEVSLEDYQYFRKRCLEFAD
ncbi:MAG: uroporphyrinogen decarboxylase family protein [Eubacteriales bacterium]|nr:uroporphyrinogen decarboxylase family protein [Eubacteriales bacterium]